MKGTVIDWFILQQGYKFNINIFILNINRYRKQYTKIHFFKQKKYTLIKKSVLFHINIQ